MSVALGSAGAPATVSLYDDIPAPDDGVPHFMKGMVDVVTVV